MRFVKTLLVAAASLVSLQAQAQLPAIGVPPALEVQRLAPQLVTFFGPGTNFQSLVNGLATATPVTLSTVGADGLTRIVTFTPTSPLSALQAAQVLEAARQSLITRGIVTPTAEQTAVTLVGGTLQTATGAVQTTALVPAGTSTTATPTGGFTGSAAAGASQPSPAVTLQQQITPATGAGAQFTSSSPILRNVSDTPPAPGPASPAASATPPAAAPAAPIATPVSPVTGRPAPFRAQ